jgi:hypothetical protein
MKAESTGWWQVHLGQLAVKGLHATIGLTREGRAQPFGCLWHNRRQEEAHDGTEQK